MTDRPNEPNEKELDELEEHIQRVKNDPDTQTAEHGSFYDPNYRFNESGDERGDEDDQTIAPG